MLFLQHGTPPNFASTTLSFNPVPKFLGITFDKTHFFESHGLSFCTKFFPHFKALCSIATASWGPSNESLYQLYKAFTWPVLSYASWGGSPSSAMQGKKGMEVYHMKRLQSNLWLSRLYSYLTTALGITQPSTGKHIE